MNAFSVSAKPGLFLFTIHDLLFTFNKMFMPLVYLLICLFLISAGPSFVQQPARPEPAPAELKETYSPRRP